MRGLLSLLLIIFVLLVIMRLASPIRGGKPDGKRRAYRYRARRDLRTLRLYDAENQLLGPLIVALLLLSDVLGDDPSLLTVCVLAGAVLGVMNRISSAWKTLLIVMAAVGLSLQYLQFFRLMAEPHEAGLLASLYKASFLLLVWACFSLGALFSVVWSRNLSIKALSFVVILELLMVIADPAFEASLANPLAATVTWGLVACCVAIFLGLFSFPITLDLLSVGTALALWSSTAGADIVPVLVGVLVGVFARAVLSR